MSFGIGLGAFVEGFGRGVEIRQTLDARAEARDQKKALSAIDTETQQKFDEGVKDGTQQPDDFMDFYSTYAVPRKQKELLAQGKADEAEQYGKWADGTAAKKGAKLFSSALLKANTGDYGGALGDAIKAANVKGYVDHGYELKGQTELKDAQGNVIGFRLTVHDGKKDIQQDVAIADIPNLIATFTNPDAAWASQQAAAAKEKGRGEELTDYEAKKKIDRKYPADKDGDYAKRYESTRKAVAEEQQLADAPLDDAGIDAETKRRIDEADAYAATKGSAAAAPATEGLGQPAPAQAQPAPSGKTVTVDTVTGEPVDPAAVGLGAAGVPAPQGEAPTPAAQKTSAAESASPTRQQMIADAADAIATGGNPQYVAQQLNNAGVTQEEWPVELRAAFRGQAGPSRSQAAGLGQ